jgi:hypothetical protein
LTCLQENLGSHPVVRAWKQLPGARAEPDRIEVLRNGGKSGIYRLRGAGPSGASVIAKQSRRHGRSSDVVVHLHVHPRLSLRLVECYGFVEPAENELSTLFLEDAGSVRYSPLSAAARVLAARWLAALHRDVASAGLGPSELQHLPDRGPDHYRDVLDLARDAISRWRTPPPGHDAAGLRGLLLSQLDEIEARWRVIAAICSSAPRTLVHGDLCAQNMYVTASASGEPTLLPVDWEETGYGPPAVDLAQLLPGHVHFAAGADLAAYASAMQDVWPSLDPATVHLLSTAGTIFRAIAAIRWATQSVTDEWWRDGEVDELRVYGSVVEHALVQLDSPT